MAAFRGVFSTLALLFDDALPASIFIVRLEIKTKTKQKQNKNRIKTESKQNQNSKKNSKKTQKKLKTNSQDLDGIEAFYNLLQDTHVCSILKTHCFNVLAHCMQHPYALECFVSPKVFSCFTAEVVMNTLFVNFLN